MSFSQLQIRFFISNGCQTCKKLMQAFDFHGFPYEIIDADDEANDNLCEVNKVDELPHIQVLDGENNEIYSRVGFVAPHALIALVSSHLENTDRDMYIQGVRASDQSGSTDQEGDKHRECGGCKDRS